MSAASNRYADKPTTPNAPISSTAHNPAVNGSHPRLHWAGPSAAGRQNAGLKSSCCAHTNTSPNRITAPVSTVTTVCRNCTGALFQKLSMSSTATAPIASTSGTATACQSVQDRVMRPTPPSQDSPLVEKEGRPDSEHHGQGDQGRPGDQLDPAQVDGERGRRVLGRITLGPLAAGPGPDPRGTAGARAAGSTPPSVRSPVRQSP